MIAEGTMVRAFRPATGISLFEEAFAVPRIFRTLFPLPSIYMTPFGAAPAAAPPGSSPWGRPEPAPRWPSLLWPDEVFAGVVEALAEALVRDLRQLPPSEGTATGDPDAEPR